MNAKTKNPLPAPARKTVIGLLSARLADLQDLYFQSKQAHWAVRGPHFIAYHQLFDQVAEIVEEPIDDVAERIGQLGGQVAGTVQAVAKRTTLAPYPLDLVDGPDHLGALSTALAHVAGNVRGDIDAAARAGDTHTADLFTEVSRGLDKALWLVEAHAQART
jgi:starvation-inducible DNA-binding protein